MARLVGAAVMAAAATLTLAGCATTAQTSRPIIPTMNQPTPETETMYAAVEPDGDRRG